MTGLDWAAADLMNELRRDAARYRWLRADPVARFEEVTSFAAMDALPSDCAAPLDAAIDAAMLSERSKP